MKTSNTDNAANIVMEKDFGPALGWLRIEANSEGVTEIAFIVKPRRAPRGESNQHVKRSISALQAYAKGKEPGTLPSLVFDTTDFRGRVYDALMKVPAGRTLSYAELAEKAGSPKAARAVGAAMAANRHPVLVPCHRVLASNQKLGGFSGGLNRKRALLDHEGANWKE